MKSIFLKKKYFHSIIPNLAMETFSFRWSSNDFTWLRLSAPKLLELIERVIKEGFSYQYDHVYN